MSSRKKPRKPRTPTQEDCIYAALDVLTEAATHLLALKRVSRKSRGRIGDPLMAAMIYLRHAVAPTT